MSTPKKPGSSSNSRPVSANGRPITRPTSGAKPAASAGAKSANPSRPISQQSTAISKPVGTKSATVSRPVTETKSGSSVVKRAPIASARQARLQAQRDKERNQKVITGIFAVVLVAVLAFAVFQLFPRGGTSTKSGGASVAQTFGVPADFAPGGKSKVKAQGKLTTLPDGVQYIDIKTGSGQAVKSTDTVTTNYIGWLTNGTKFDSSYDRGQPTQFPLNGVIKGWTEGLVGMQIGTERRLLIPAAEGYGASGQPPTIPPNATLIFDVTLVSIP